MSILLLGVKNSYAQFNKVRVGKIPPMMEVFQVDNRESSTMVYIKYTRREGIDWSNINEKRKLKEWEQVFNGDTKNDN